MYLIKVWQATAMAKLYSYLHLTGKLETIDEYRIVCKWLIFECRLYRIWTSSHP